MTEFMFKFVIREIKSLKIEAGLQYKMKQINRYSPFPSTLNLGKQQIYSFCEFWDLAKSQIFGNFFKAHCQLIEMAHIKITNLFIPLPLKKKQKKTDLFILVRKGVHFDDVLRGPSVDMPQPLFQTQQFL